MNHNAEKMTKLLYAEDDRRDIDLTVTHLAEEAPEFSVRTVTTGEACLAELRGGEYSLLLLDNHLPDTEGLQLLRRIRQENFKVPVILVTAAGNEDIVMQALRAGASDYVAKSGDYLPLLTNSIRRVLADKRMDREEAGPRNILYVESSTMDVDLTAQYFEDQASQFVLHTVSSAEEALKMVHGAQNFDLIISDLNLRGMSAIELLRELRFRNLNIPTVVITGRGTEERAVAAMQLGAYDYIVKRGDYLERLLDAVRNAIERAEAQAREDALRNELERVNADLKSKVDELTRSTADLDAFSYSIAHELKAPLRSMGSFAQVVIEDCGESLSGPCRDYLDRIANSAKRMGRLIEDILQFHRSATQNLRREPVDPNAIVQQVIHDLASEWQSRKVNFSVDTLPTLMGDTPLLRQVFVNLISNALKFTRGRAIAEIEVRAQPSRSRDKAIIFVRDNGVGFDSEDTGKVFALFETVHSRQTYEGTGVGVPIVRRIVERHGGTMWAEGKRDVGATFFIELPVAK